MHELDDETLKTLFLKYIRYEWIGLLNLMGKWDVLWLSFGEICDLCKHISSGKARTGKNPRNPIMSRISKSLPRTISTCELWNFLDSFKLDILGSLSE